MGPDFDYAICRESLRRAFDDRLIRRTAVSLIGLDVLLILANLIFMALFMFGVVNEKLPILFVYVEDSIASYLMYAKWAFLACALAACSVRYSVLPFSVLSALFAYILLDDALQIHEHAGVAIAKWLGLESFWGAPPESVGELLFLALVAIVSLASLVLAVAFSKSRWRNWGYAFLLGLAGLAFFGVIVDAIHSTIGIKGGSVPQQILDVSLAIIEDGGEMIFASCLCILTVMLWSGRPQPQLATH